MERLKCKACESYSMMPMEVAVEEQGEASQASDQESKFYTCHVCGDNWLSVQEVGDNGDCRITFVHQMGMAPILKRVAHMHNHVLFTEQSAQSAGLWEYFLDDESVEEDSWHAKLNSRRRVLKSICSN